MAADAIPAIHPAEARSTVQAYLPDGRVIEGPRGSQLQLFVERLSGQPAPVVGAVVNGELRELTFALDMDARLRPVTMAEADGMRIYRRSLTFLLASVFEELFPGTSLTVDHSVASGGYFCQVTGREALDEDELARLEAAMRDRVNQDLPIGKIQVPLEDAIEHFRAGGLDDKVRLLRHRRKPYLVLYILGTTATTTTATWSRAPATCAGSGWFAPATVSLCDFPAGISPIGFSRCRSYPKLLGTFRQYGDWLEPPGDLVRRRRSTTPSPKAGRPRWSSSRKPCTSAASPRSPGRSPSVSDAFAWC